MGVMAAIYRSILDINEKIMKQLGTSMHKDMSAYQMDFGFGGFVGYGGGVSAGLVKEEPRRRMMCDG